MSTLSELVAEARGMVDDYNAGCPPLAGDAVDLVERLLDALGLAHPYGGDDAA